MGLGWTRNFLWPTPGRHSADTKQANASRRKAIVRPAWVHEAEAESDFIQNALLKWRFSNASRSMLLTQPPSWLNQVTTPGTLLAGTQACTLDIVWYLKPYYSQSLMDAVLQRSKRFQSTHLLTSPNLDF